MVGDDDLQQHAEQFAAELAAAARASTACVKKLLLTSFDNNLETQMEIEGRFVSQCAASRDGQEGIHAFVEKRKPDFA